jgi:hypothetical protein
LSVNGDNFLWPEEEKLFIHITILNERAIAFNDAERGVLRDDYFSPYIIPVVEHVPWEFKNIPIPPGIKDEVIKTLRERMEAGVYEPSQASYRSKWFCVAKKEKGKVRIVHSLEPLNAVTIRDAGVPPVLDEFVENFAGRACTSVFDLYSGYDARVIHPQSRDLTTFHSPLGLLRLTVIPQGFTNAVSEFQNCMTFILKDEIPHKTNVFVDDNPIKGPATQYLDEKGNPEVMKENPGIRRFIWEHAQDVHRIMHRIACAGATYAGKKMQICRPRVIILGQECTPEGRVPDISKVEKILNWPTLRTVKEVRQFLGLCGTVRIWILNYSIVIRPLTELWRKEVEFIWTEIREDAFRKIKELVSTAPALVSINYESSNIVILSVDSSYKGVGFILSQLDDNGKRRPARYGSLPFNERESRYSQPKLELYGLFRALRHYRHYLYGVKNLHVEVDAKYIKGMINSPDIQPNAAMNRWVQGILLFDFKLVHVPATQFRGPDALSRREITEEEKEAAQENDDWLDDVGLHLTGTPQSCDISQIEPTCVLLSHVFYNHNQGQFFPKCERLSGMVVSSFRNIQERKRFLQ